MQSIVDVEGIERAAALAGQPLSLSVCAVTRGDSTILPGVLEVLRPLATEIIVALDDRAEAAASQLSSATDSVVLFPHREPGDAIIPWLHAQCGGRWILNLDDDEVPSLGLLEQVPELIGADVTHWWLPRRWLVGTFETFLDEAPWVPDYQLRLYRNDQRTLRFSDDFHRPVVVSGPAGFARNPLWHLDCVRTSFQQRRQKALSYERERRGMRVAGFAHNSAFYLPELRPFARKAAVPEEDVRLIRRVLAQPTAVSRPPGPLRTTRREDIDALWPGAPFDPSMWTAKLTQMEALERLVAGARHTVTMAIENRGRVDWMRGSEASPLVQVGTRWLTEDGTIEEGLHTPLPADLAAGRSVDIPVHVAAPERPGRYRLAVDLVHEHVRWFGCAVEWQVEVLPAHRIAVIGRGERLEEALDRLQLEPELDPMIVEPDSAVTPEQFGHDRVPGLGSYLLDGIDGRIGPTELARLCARTTRLLRRASRLRKGKATAPLPYGAEECLAALGRCERLLVTGGDWEPDAAISRQLWRLAATTAAARRLGLAVRVETDAIEVRDMIDRLLARLVRGV